MLFSNDASAAGLGKLTVLSALGQPLHAEIELTSVTKDEAGTLAPKLASMEAFRQANVDFNPALLSLRFAVEKRGGRQFIRVTSAQPINEPFVDMLLELGGANGRLIREYTFLLDPADLRSTQPAQAAPPVMLAPAPLARRAPNGAAESVSTSNAEKAPQQTAAKQSKPASAAKPAAPAKDSAVISEYKVKSGDSLSRIAGRIKPEGISLDQMLVALYRANPEAFVGNNMNRLRAGQVLSVPDAGAAASVSDSEARNIVIAQAADFNNYRNKLADQVATSETRKTTGSDHSATGKITAKVEEHPTAANESKDKLKLSKAGAAADKASSIATGTEDKIAQEKALAEANARVKELEKNVGDLQKILEIKNKGMADQQKQVDVANTATTPAMPAAGAAAASAASMTDAKVPVAKTDTSTAPATPTAASASVAASAPKAAAAVRPKPKKVAPPPSEPSFLDDLLDNPLLLPGIAALVVALGGLGFYNIRRRRQSKQFEDSIITDSSLKANSLFGSTGGQSVDTNNSVFNSSFAPSVGSLDSNEVDPVAEADVYIAYGRDAQAEEILKEALRTQPERHGVRVKLLEIYANRKDLRAFESLASELYALTKGEGEDWRQAVSLGAGIDPNNPLYAAGKTPGKAMIATAMTAPTQPLEEPDLDALLAVTQSDDSPETSSAIEDSAYFANAALTAEAPASEFELTQPKEESSETNAETPPNDLDFDLDGLGIDQIEAPNTIPRPMPVEPQEDIEEINFDFLDEKNAVADLDPTTAEPVVETIVAEPPAIEALTLDMPAAEDASATTTVVAAEAAVDGPVTMPSDLPDLQAIAHTNEPGDAAEKTEALEFDLSGITLDLGQAEAKSGLVQKAYGVHDTGDDYSNSAEMATKLDLAVAYQEIGDKEGARELLDEVAKGGTPEQSEKARSLLAKLG